MYQGQLYGGEGEIQGEGICGLKRMYRSTNARIIYFRVTALWTWMNIEIYNMASYLKL
jgi:hypothetical protein